MTVSGGSVTSVDVDPNNRGRNYSYSQQLSTQNASGWYNLNTSSFYIQPAGEYIVCNITQLYGEWELMFAGILQMVDFLQSSIESGRIRIGMCYFAQCQAQQGIFLNLSNNYTTIRNTVIYYSNPDNRPGTGGTTWGPGLALAYSMLADPVYYDPSRQKKIMIITDGIGADTYNLSVCSDDQGPTFGITPYDVSNDMQNGLWTGGDSRFWPQLPAFPVTMMGIAINSSDVPGLSAAVANITSPGNNFFDVATFEDFTSIAGSIALTLICLEGKYRIAKYELENFLTDLDTPPTAVGHNFTSKIKNAVAYFDSTLEGSAAIIPAGSAIFIKDAFIIPQGNLTGAGNISAGLSVVDNTGAAISSLTTDQSLVPFGITSNDTLELIRTAKPFATYTENGPAYKSDNSVDIVRNSVPVMISANNATSMTSGAFWVVVPYMTLKPNYGDDPINTTYNLWVTGSTPQGSTGIALPVPSLKLSRDTGVIKVWDWLSNGTAGTAGISSPPVIVANDLTQEMLSSYRIFVEMLVYRRGKRPGSAALTPINTGTQSSGYITPSPWFVEMTPPNNVPYFPWNATGGFWTRSGDHNWIGTATVSVDRPNHYEVTSVNQKIPVWEYLNGRFTTETVDYRGTSGIIQSLENLVIPVTRRDSNSNVGARFPYSSKYTPLYAAFRYIAWDPNVNGGLGQIISGPLSKVIKVSHKKFPFMYDWAASGLHNYACASTLWSGTSGGPIEGPNSELKCWIETRLP